MELIINEMNETNENHLNIKVNIHELVHHEEKQPNINIDQTKTKQEKREECIELKNIKYKTMLMKGVPLKETESCNDLSNLDKFLDNEKTNNQNEQWCKLDKTIKTQKLLAFVEIYKKEKNLDEEDTQILIQFFKECLNKKKLARVKDVVYDRMTGEIKEIPALVHTKKHFTLKNLDKHVSTIKSLTPKKPLKSKNKTMVSKEKIISRKKEDKEEEEEEEEEE